MTVESGFVLLLAIPVISLAIGLAALLFGQLLQSLGSIIRDLTN